MTKSEILSILRRTISCHESFLNKFWLSVFLLGAITGNANASSWPQEITGDKGTIIIYQPQPEKLVGYILTGRAAMQLELNNKKEPVFGLFWFSSTIETDRDTNSVIINEIEVIKVGWPESNDADEAAFTEFVEQKLQHSSFTSSLSKLTATLASSEEVQKSLDNIKNDPPVIIFKDQLAVLLSYDGKPIFKDIESSPYQRALNTQFAVIKVNNKAQYYLTSGSIWYQASNELGPWIVTDYPPADLVKMIAKAAPDADKQKTTFRFLLMSNGSSLVFTVSAIFSFKIRHLIHTPFSTAVFSC